MTEHNPGQTTGSGVSQREEEDSHESISMVEVLEEEQQREEDANAVLGASDDKHCTYPQGSLLRQALYSCTTCITADKEPAGVCLACCLECHEGHDLVELYTKRNFCCDCGNTKFGDKKCKLWPEKKSVNADNQYNQNFRGDYCTCHRPYPDPEDEVEDDMIQCVICEDWFHGRHLMSKVPPGNDFEEMTCLLCVEKHPFLLSYKQLQAVLHDHTITKITKDEPKEDVDICETAENGKVENSSSNPDVIDAEKGINETVDTKDKETNQETKTENIGALGDNSTSVVEASEAEMQSSFGSSLGDSSKSTPSAEVTEEDQSKKCILQPLKKETCPEGGVSLFWNKNWRKGLCHCEKCMQMYKDRSISFITDESDTITMYEEKGKQAQGSQYEKGMEALSQMNRVQQVEMISGYNDLKTELKNYLKTFADNGQVVKEENIHQFFTTMAGRKRQRVDIPYHCK